MRFHGSLLDMLNSATKVKIVRFLLTHEASMSEREIASILKVSHMSVNRSLRELAASHFCSFMTIGRAHVWKVNRKSYAFKALSTLLLNETAIPTPLGDLKKTLARHLPSGLVLKAVLFGSLSQGAERPDSDIDLFVLVRNADDKKRLEPAIEKLSDICFEAYGNRLAPYILTEQEMRQKKGLALLSAIGSGIPLV